MMQVVIVPGIDNSDAEHWQSIWQAEWGGSASRIEVGSWSFPQLDDWDEAIDRAVRRAGAREVVLLAHSLGCLAASRWCAARQRDIRGLFLVAPPDPAGASFPAAASTFTRLQPEPVGVPGLVVSSANDPYCTPDVARQLARGWGVPRIDIGPYGHLNVASGVGRWELGRMLFTAFTAGSDSGPTKRPLA
jgi:predicted alpha/beta hydrolase family esterase